MRITRTPEEIWWISYDAWGAQAVDAVVAFFQYRGI